MKRNYCLRCNQAVEAGKMHYGQHIKCFKEIFFALSPQLSDEDAFGFCLAVDINFFGFRHIF